MALGLLSPLHPEVTWLSPAPRSRSEPSGLSGRGGDRLCMHISVFKKPYAPASGEAKRFSVMALSLPP